MKLIVNNVVHNNIVYAGLFLSLTLLFLPPRAKALTTTLAKTLPIQLAPACAANVTTKKVCSLPILDLHPTQFTVGLLAVSTRAAEFEREKPKKFAKYMKGHAVPVILGPEHIFYMIDHHHLALALYKDGVRALNVEVKQDWSNLAPERFWTKMTSTNDVYLYDNSSGPFSPADLPATVLQLHDDIYRSLAWAVRSQTKAYENSTEPFAGFQWADFFRSRVPESLVRDDFERAVHMGAELARSPAARNLPGFI